jgi:hypothetical protein
MTSNNPVNINPISPIQGQLIITNCAFAMDGGSKVLIGKDSTGKEIHFHLPQHGIISNFTEDLTPGRLHVNGEPIEVRSELEWDILIKLSESIIESPFETEKDHSISDMVKEIIHFIKSDEYVEVAKRFGE